MGVVFYEALERIVKDEFTCLNGEDVPCGIASNRICVPSLRKLWDETLCLGKEVQCMV
jgi:hypothetical protein